MIVTFNGFITINISAFYTKIFLDIIFWHNNWIKNYTGKKIINFTILQQSSTSKKLTVMKAKLYSLIMGLLFITNTQIWAQRKVTVEAVNDDISYYLDLKAVAYIFGESDNLEDFEYKLNDPENNLSNLDLNGDGYIDYLRVIETNEKNVHLVVIQAVLDRDVYQDVATIAVGKTRYNKLQIQVIGDPYIYGYNYIIEPYYYRTPVIVRWFWSPYYTRWYSPYYWGYYPRFYSYRSPVHINIYINHVHNRISRVNNHYNYSNSIRFNDYDRLHSSVRRNDFEKKNPDRAFSNRNREVQNHRELNPSGGRNDNRINNNGFGNRNDNGWRENSETNRRNDNYNRMNSNMPGNTRVDNNNSQRNNRSESVRIENSGTRVNGNVSRENNGYNRENNNPSNYYRSGYENRNGTSPQRENATTRTQSRPEQRSSNTETRQAPVRTQQQFERSTNTETRQAPTRSQQHVEMNPRSEPTPRVQPRQESPSTPRVSTPSRSTESSAPAQKTPAASRNNSENNNSSNQNTRR